MCKLAHICFTLIIYKQFNFCSFRASAYTNVDRLCAVFLYNICCFHHFFETSTPIKNKHWITLIPYKNDVNAENFSKWRPSAIFNLRKIVVLVMWPISPCDPSSMFQISRWSANMAPINIQKLFSIWRPSAILDLLWRHRIESENYTLRSQLCVKFLRRSVS